MWRKDSKKDSGFTLIELLVVIAIIALLSTIVLSSLSDARAKARNASRVTLVRQYMNALELYRNDNGSYPYSAITQNTYYCLGETGSNVCFIQSGFGIDGNSTLNSSISPYIPGPPAMLEKILGDTGNMHGLLYRCTNLSSSKCNNYELYWLGETSNPFCGPGIAGSSSGNNKFCDFSN